MTKPSLSSTGRQALIDKLSAHSAWKSSASQNHPAIFRQLIRIRDGEQGLLRDGLQDWQTADFAALDDAWRCLAGHDVTPAIRRAWTERPRGHSKTTDMAVQAAWVLQAARDPLRGIAAAADRDQAGLIRAAISDLVYRNADLCPDLDVQSHLIRNEKTHAHLEIMSSDVRSSWGQLPDFVICDELCHWAKPDLWYSLLSSAAKKPTCVLTVLTNAGVGRGWQWEIREAARTSPDWHFSSLQGSQAPWISDRDLAEQQRLLPRPVFDRLCPSALQQPLTDACRGRAVFHPAGWTARRYLCNWDALVYHHPQLEESFGRTVAEALRAGCLPIVDRQGGFVEQLAEGCGQLCGTTAEFIAALQGLWDRAVRGRMSQLAQLRGDREFSLARFGQALLMRFDQAAARRRAGSAAPQVAGGSAASPRASRSA